MTDKWVPIFHLIFVGLFADRWVQVKWVEKRWMPREFRKVLYRLDRKDYQDALTTISKGVNDLESLARLSVALEPSRRKRSGGRVIGMLRGLSASLYRALRSSISCQCAGPHDISLRLSPWFAEHGYDDDDEKVVSGTKFRVAISFERDGAGSEEKKIWDEVDIKKHPKAPTVPPTTLPTPPVCLPVVAKSKRARFVAFSKSQTTITSTALKPSTKQEKGATDIRNALADVTRQLRATSLIATEITPISLSHSSTQSFPASVSMTPVDICGTLKRTLGTRPDCYGQLVDSECLENCFGMYPRITDTIGHKTWSIITLDDVLWQKQGLQPLLWLEEKVRLALAVASAVLQLSKTQWLSKPLTKQDIHFFGNNEGPSYQHPFLGRQIPERQNPCATTREDDATALQPNATLFRLGILLLEIILGSTLENLREPHERIEFPGDRFGMIRDSITAHRLLQTRVALINPAYKAVVERCVGCGSSQALDEEGFGERVYSGVVAELEAILDCTRLS